MWAVIGCILLYVFAAIGVFFCGLLLWFWVEENLLPPSFGPRPPGPSPEGPEQFEVNMVEPLVGWKRWHLNSEGLLTSLHDATTWVPDKALQAACSTGRHDPAIREACSCGIYAADVPQGANGYGPVQGMVYGWGRYVRGTNGWRAQWAYPKAFYLAHDQGHLIETLKKYHVEIFVDEPLRVFDPEEEGYSNGYRQAEKDGRG